MLLELFLWLEMSPCKGQRPANRMLFRSIVRSEGRRIVCAGALPNVVSPWRRAAPLWKTRAGLHRENRAPPIMVSKRADVPKLSNVASDDPELRASSRVRSRLEARRSSVMGSGSLDQQSPYDYPQAESTTPTQDRPPFQNNFERASSVIRRRDDDNESNVSRRTSSRAATEVGSHRPSPPTRISREYTSQHPMPSPTLRSPSVQSSLPTRKSYFQATSFSSPHTPNIQPGNRRYLNRNTPISADNARLTEARQRRLASLGQGSSARGLRAGSSSGKLSSVETEKG